MSQVRSLLLGAAVVAGPLFIASANASFLIDDFNSGSATTSTITASSNAYESAASTLGGSRDVLIRNFAAPDGVASSGAVASGLFTGVRGGDGSGDIRLSYHGPAAPDSTTIVGDFSEVTAINLDFTANTTSALTAKVVFTSYGWAWRDYTETASAAVYVPTGASSVSIPVSSPAGGIDDVTILFSYSPDPYVWNQTVNQSFTVDSITAVVPEPTSIGLLTLGGLVALRRRR